MRFHNEDESMGGWEERGLGECGRCRSVLGDCGLADDRLCIKGTVYKVRRRRMEHLN